MRLRVRLPALLFLVVTACLLLLLLTIFELRSIRTEHDTFHHAEPLVRPSRPTGLTYALYGRDWEKGGYLVHVTKVIII